MIEMEVAIIHTDFRLYWIARLRALSVYLKERGINLHIIELCGKGSPYKFAEEIKMPTDNWRQLFPDAGPEDISGRKIKRPLFELLDRLNPEIVIAGAIAFPSGALSIQWAKKRRKKTVIFDDAKIENVIRNGFVNFIKKRVYSGVDAIIYPADEWDETGKFWGFEDQRMFYGIDVVDNDFWNMRPQKSPFTEKYFIAGGRLIPEKNFAGVLKAYSTYLNKADSADKIDKLVLYGNGPERGNITAIIKEYELERNVIIKDFLSQEELRSYFSSASLYILFSNYESWGLSVNEALASGCPVAVSERCGCARSLVDCSTGAILTPEDTEGLANYMKKIAAKSPEEMEMMREGCKIKISRWGLGRFCAAVNQAIHYCVSNPGRKISLTTRMIIRMWNGRYRPV